MTTKLEKIKVIFSKGIPKTFLLFVSGAFFWIYLMGFFAWIASWFLPHFDKGNFCYTTDAMLVWVECNEQLYFHSAYEFLFNLIGFDLLQLIPMYIFTGAFIFKPLMILKVLFLISGLYMAIMHPSWRTGKRFWTMPINKRNRMIFHKDLEN